MTASNLRPIDFSRAARLALALSRGDLDQVNVALQAARVDRSPHLLTCALGALVVESMTGPQMTEGAARAWLRLRIAGDPADPAEELPGPDDPAALDVMIVPADQRRAAELTEAFVTAFTTEDETGVGQILTDIAEAGLGSALATVALLGRHSALALTELLGPEAAARHLERTRLDASLADDPAEGHDDE